MLSPVTISSSDGTTEADFVPEANMVCCALRHHGEEVLDTGRGLEAYAQRGKTMGIPLLYPWANRLSRFGYAAAGATVELPSDDGRLGTDPNGLPIHGVMPGELRWSVDAGSPPHRITARLDWDAPELLEIFPFAHALTMEAGLDGSELTITTTVHATAGDRVPVSFGFHPYLTLPGEPRTGWRIALGAREKLILDDAMIPTGAREPLAERAFVLADQSWDDGLAALDDPPVFAVAGERHTVTVTFDEGFHWAQVYAPPGHDYICFEPMAAPTDALNSGEGLAVVQPGSDYRTAFSVRVTPAPA